MDSKTAAQLFEDAERRYSERRFAEALDLLDQLSHQLPLHEAVEFARAQTYVMLRRISDAEAACDNLLPLFGAEGVAELKQVLRDLEHSGDDELEWGFLRPTEEPVTFASLDVSPLAKTSPVSDDIESFFAELDAESIDALDAIEVVDPKRPARSRRGVHDDLGPIAMPTPVPPPPQESHAPEGSVDDFLTGFDAAPGAETGVSGDGDPYEQPSSEQPQPTPGFADGIDLEPLADVDSAPGMPPDEPSATPRPSLFSQAHNPLGALGDDSISIGEDVLEVASAEVPSTSSPDAFDSDVGDLGALSPLEDEAPVAKAPAPARMDFGDLGELGDLGPPDTEDDTPLPRHTSANLPPVDDAISDFKLSGLSDFGSDDSNPEVEAQAAPAVNPWDDTNIEHKEVPKPVAMSGPDYRTAIDDAPMPAVVDVESPSPQSSVFDEPMTPLPIDSPARAQALESQRRSRAPFVLIVLLVLSVGGGGTWYYLKMNAPDAQGGAVSPFESPAQENSSPAIAILSDEPELTRETFESMLAALGTEGDPAPVIQQLQEISNVAEWPSSDQPALALVVEAAGGHVGSGAETPYVEIARALLERGANANQTDRRGQFLVELAAQQSDEPMVRLLLERGATATPKLLAWAARTGRLPLVQELLKSQPDAATPEALYAAIDARHDAIAKVLLEQGVELDAVMPLAVQRGARHVFRYALDGGVNVASHPDLLQLAIDAQQPTMVELLLQSGADPRRTNTSGQSPVEMLQGKTQKSAADQEILRILNEQLAVRPATTPTVAAASVPDAPAKDLGKLFTRSKQQESEWSAAGPWRGKLPAAANSVYKVEISAKRPEDLSVLEALRPGDLYALRVEGSGVTDETLHYIGALSGLRELEIIGARISDSGIQHLDKLTLLTSLRIASPPDAPRAQVNGPGLTILRPMLHLTQLDVSGTTFGDRALPVLDGLSGIKVLNLAGTEVTDASLGSLRNLRNLEVLAFGTGEGLSSRITGSALYALRDLTNLRELHLYGVPMSKTGFDALATLRRLSYIDLRHTGITSKDVEQIASLKQVGTVLLSGNDLSQDARTTLQNRLPGARLEF